MYMVISFQKTIFQRTKGTKDKLRSWLFLLANQEHVVREKFKVVDFRVAEIDVGIFQIGLGTDKLEDVDFTVFPLVAVEFLLPFDEIALKLLKFDGAGVFVQTAFIAADVGAKFLAEREIFGIVAGEIILRDFIASDVRSAADGPVE